MQSAAELKKNELQQKLQPYFKNYADEHNQIPIAKVQSFVREVLKQTTRQEIDYVIRNMFRVDGDNSGKVSKNELRNFLFRRHCGQMSLQKAHRENKISRGKEHLINAGEFHTLINNAVHFLAVTIDQQSSSQLFKKADKDNDNHITYVQYFQIINQTFCDSKDNKVPPVPPPPAKKTWKSKFRAYLQVELRRIFDRDIAGRNLRSLLGPTLSIFDQVQLYCLQKNIQENSIPSFAPFFNLFIKNLALKELGRFNDGCYCSQRSLNRDQFLSLLFDTFEILNIVRVKKALLIQLFQAIDKNKSNSISYNEYIDWVQNYLCVTEIEQSRYFIKFDHAGYTQIILQPVNYFNFCNYQYSVNTKKKLHSLIVPFDKNEDQVLQKEELTNILKNTLKSSQDQLKYFLENLHRVDVNGDGKVSYREFVDASLKTHFGQITNKRYHNKNRRSNWRIMNKEQFNHSIGQALKAVGVEFTSKDLDTVWRAVDPQGYGWIHYDVYFYFLLRYFGVDYQHDWFDDLKKLSVIERFKRIYFYQLSKGIEGYDENRNKFYERKEILQILKNYFGFYYHTTGVTLLSLSLMYELENKMTLDSLIRIILEGYFVTSISDRANKADWNKKTISQDEFVQFFLIHSGFLDRKPPQQDLVQIFKILDKNNCGTITIRQFVNFIVSTLGIGLKQFKEECEFNDQEFADLIWCELYEYFLRYDKDRSGFIDRCQLESFMREVLGDNTRFGHAFVFRNFGYKVDSDKNQKVSFKQFVPFALFYSGQHALRSFHERYPPGRKHELNCQEFSGIVQRAFCFLRSFEKYTDKINSLYAKLGKGSQVTYVQYFTWLSDVSRFRERKAQ